jgi:FkbM family methyltransferase
MEVSMKLKDVIEKYNSKITGIIHAGAHFGKESVTYRANGIRDVFFFEPVKRTFDVLTQNASDYTCIHSALGDKEGFEEIYIETANNGQSCSLLKPKKHLEQYPYIQFESKETIQITKLDSYEITQCNFLNMDVQGYELNVLKGATKTLEYIDFIYTEVNRDELYENCVQVEELDEYLKDFERVMTNWCGDTWGDALYIRKGLDV